MSLSATLSPGAFLDEYTLELARTINELQRHGAQDDLANVELTAHALKSNCRTLGAPQLAELASEIEQHATMRSSAFGPLVAELAPAHRRFVKALTRARARAGW